MKKICLFFFYLFFSLSSFSQIPTIKKELFELFFEIPINASKYDVRKSLDQSELIYKIEESDNQHKNQYYIYGYFTNNYKLGNLDGVKTMWVNFCFVLENSEPYFRELIFQYEVNSTNVEKSERLLKEIRDLFSQSSIEKEEPIINDNFNKIEKCSYFLSTEYSKQNRPYLIVDRTITNKIIVISTELLPFNL